LTTPAQFVRHGLWARVEADAPASSPSPGVVKRRPCYEAESVDKKMLRLALPQHRMIGGGGLKGATGTFSAMTRERPAHGPSCYPSAGAGSARAVR
jgi:hypothetical protein